MIECIFTIDYEIYGNGTGSLRELVYEPTEKLKAVFQGWNAPFVTFVEAAELQKIEECHTDEAIVDIRHQIRDLHRQGFEIGLHLHPQWYNARYENGEWLLDYSEYNLCSLPRERISQIINCSIAYLRNVLSSSEFTPLSFRAGNWLFQPTNTAANVLAEAGIKIDSSVFKGGLQRNLKLDYRPALRNGYYWSFEKDVNVQDRTGSLIEIPTYTMMVPFWKMLTKKRVNLQRNSPTSLQINRKVKSSIVDYLRPRYPLKFDFCRMNADELLIMMNKIVEKDKDSPNVYRPIVAIGHTKDLYDLDSINYFLSYLIKNGINVTTFSEVYAKCQL